jgi:hypothetical protein
MRKGIAAFLSLTILAWSSAGHAAKIGPDDLLKGCINLGNMRSADSNQPIRLSFFNKTKNNIKIYWIDYQGDKKLYETLAPDQNLVEPTYATHPWLITDSFNNCLGAFVASETQDVDVKDSVATPSSLEKKLKKYTNAWGILDDPTVMQNMKAVMGNKYSLFNERTQILDQLQVNGDEIFSEGGVAGLHTIMEGAFVVDAKTGRVQVALLDDRALNVWGAAGASDLSDGMRNYIKDLQERKCNREACDPDNEIKVSFEAPDQSTIESEPATKSKMKKHLSTASPSGTYVREGQFDRATLEIDELKDNKIKFKLSAVYGANTGDASGIIPLINNTGVYESEGFDKGEGFKLTFRYRGGVIDVDESGSGFGGLNVDAGGTYKKTDDKAPVIESDDVGFEGPDQFTIESEPAIKAKRKKHVTTECIENENFLVITRGGSGVGDDIVARKKSAPHAGSPCVFNVQPSDYRIAKLGDAKYVLALQGQLLILDEGTGPSLRDLSVVDLSKDKKVWSGQYYDEQEKVNVTPQGVTFWKYLHEAKKEECKDYQNVTAQSFTPLMVVKGTLTFPDFQFKQTGAEKCIIGQ